MPKYALFVCENEKCKKEHRASSGRGVNPSGWLSAQITQVKDTPTAKGLKIDDKVVLGTCMVCSLACLAERVLQVAKEESEASDAVKTDIARCD